MHFEEIRIASEIVDKELDVVANAFNGAVPVVADLNGKLQRILFAFRVHVCDELEDEWQEFVEL